MKCKHCELTTKHIHEFFKLKGKDVSDDCDMVNGKANPFGWSQYTLTHKGKMIGFLECGAVSLTEEAKAEGYTHESYNFIPKNSL